MSAIRQMVTAENLIMIYFLLSVSVLHLNKNAYILEGRMYFLLLKGLCPHSAVFFLNTSIWAAAWRKNTVPFSQSALAFFVWPLSAHLVDTL